MQTWIGTKMSIEHNPVKVAWIPIWLYITTKLTTRMDQRLKNTLADVMYWNSETAILEQPFSIINLSINRNTQNYFLGSYTN